MDTCNIRVTFYSYKEGRNLICGTEDFTKALLKDVEDWAKDNKPEEAFKAVLSTDHGYKVLKVINF